MYHWRAGQMKRNSKGKRYTERFTIQEQNDRNDRTQYPVMPSPLGKYWLCYVNHQIKMLDDGIRAYTTRKYTRLGLDKHICSNRAIDQIAGMLTNYQPSVIFFGNGVTPSNAPIRIKKNVICPGPRKLTKAFKKRRCIVIPTNEDYTSQTCGTCYERFDRRTKNDKFKVCHDCRPRRDAMLPSRIVTRLGKRDLQAVRKLDRASHAANPDTPLSLLAKVKTYQKIWQINRETGEIVNAAAERWFDVEDELDADVERRIPHKTVWQRDVVAARCILIKGIY